MLRELLNYLRGAVRLRGRSGDGADGPGPRYGASVSYAPCPECGEGALAHDERTGETRCTACGAVVAGDRDGDTGGGSEGGARDGDA